MASTLLVRIQDSWEVLNLTNNGFLIAMDVQNRVVTCRQPSCMILEIQKDLNNLFVCSSTHTIHPIIIKCFLFKCYNFLVRLSSSLPIRFSRLGMYFWNHLVHPNGRCPPLPTMGFYVSQSTTKFIWVRNECSDPCAKWTHDNRKSVVR